MPPSVPKVPESGSEKLLKSTCFRRNKSPLLPSEAPRENKGGLQGREPVAVGLWDCDHRYCAPQSLGHRLRSVSASQCSQSPFLSVRSSALSAFTVNSKSNIILMSPRTRALCFVSHSISHTHIGGLCKTIIPITHSEGHST